MNRFGTGLTSNHLNKIEYNQLSWIDKLKIGNVSVHYLSSCLLFQRPRAFDGFTQIVANNRGHLLPGVKRSRESPWGNFVGTYDMPLKIPGIPVKLCLQEYWFVLCTYSNTYTRSSAIFMDGVIHIFFFINLSSLKFCAQLKDILHRRVPVV